VSKVFIDETSSLNFLQAKTQGAGDVSRLARCGQCAMLVANYLLDKLDFKDLAEIDAASSLTPSACCQESI